MTNVNAIVTQIYPQAGADSLGRKKGYLSASAKAAVNDTITITNASQIYLADLRLASITEEAIDITDDDSASSNGVAVYVHTKDGENAWLEFVSPTNADGTGTLNNGGSTYFVFDSDAAATDGVALYFDDDGTTASSRLLVVSPSGKDLYVSLASGKRIKLTHDASAASNGTQVYFDEDATNTYDRLLSTTANNADASSATVSEESVGDIETNTLSTNVITLTGPRVGTVQGEVYYR